MPFPAFARICKCGESLALARLYFGNDIAKCG